MKPALLASGNSHSKKTAGQPYLRVRLNPQTLAIFSLRHLQEAVVIPVQKLTPMPNLPPVLLGLINRRSRVLWAIDLPQLLQFPSSAFKAQQYNTVIVRVGGITAGLVVPEIEGMVRLTNERLEPLPSTANIQLSSYVRGCVRQNLEPLWVLDVAAILQSSLLQNY
ncbi:MAG: chemotaxis protein CheW [Geitlerinemataceae cyanobacterium]